uniref:Uncharacterized protein n=1 Tax=Anguilla anguilla TaxID=7936 RepID=A0A0E9PX24_ANGAN
MLSPLTGSYVRGSGSLPKEVVENPAPGRLDPFLDFVPAFCS